MNAFAAARIPVVVIDADISGIDTYDLVSMDNAKAAYNLTAALLASGRRHPRFVTFRDYASGVANRIAGFQLALGRVDASDIWAEVYPFFWSGKPTCHQIRPRKTRKPTSSDTESSSKESPSRFEAERDVITLCGI